MELFDLLRYVAKALDQLGLRYLVTGSMATIYYGEPRFTNDIDIVLALPPGKVAEFCKAFPAPDFYVSEEAVRQAVAEGHSFNIIHPESGLKVDMIIPRNTSFDQSRFMRRKRVKPLSGDDTEISFASIEDVIIKKMDFYREGGSEKHLRDIAGVLKISGTQVDRAYISEWAAKLGLESIWQAIVGRLEQS